MPVVQTVQYNRHACYKNRAMRPAGYLMIDSTAEFEDIRGVPTKGIG
jgi:hypothetical protein